MKQQISAAIDAASLFVQAVAQISGFLNDGSPVVMQTGKRSYFASIAATLAAFAWEGSGMEPNAIIDNLTELSAGAELLGGNFMLPDGTECLDEAAKDSLRKLVNAAHARWQLDHGEAVRIDQLAALAGVAEKTLRMATNPKNAHPLAITKQGYWTVVEADDAMDWLRRRPDFTPTRQQAQGVEQPVITDEATLADVCLQARTHSGCSDKQLAATMKWSKRQTAAYRAIERREPNDVLAEFPPKALLQLATRLKLPDPPTFARQAYAVLALAHAHSLSNRQIGTNH